MASFQFSNVIFQNIVALFVVIKIAQTDLQTNVHTSFVVFKLYLHLVGEMFVANIKTYFVPKLFVEKAFECRILKLCPLSTTLVVC